MGSLQDANTWQINLQHIKLSSRPWHCFTRFYTWPFLLPPPGFRWVEQLPLPPCHGTEAKIGHAGSYGVAKNPTNLLEKRTYGVASYIILRSYEICSMQRFCFDDDELIELMNHLNSIMRLHTFDPCVFLPLMAWYPSCTGDFWWWTSGDGDRYDR